MKQIFFRDGTFTGIANFRDVTWPVNPFDFADAFDNTQFHRSVNLTGDHFSAFSAFNGALFERSAALSYAVLHQDQQADKALMATGNAIDEHLIGIWEKEQAEREKEKAQQNGASHADPPGAVGASSPDDTGQPADRAYRKAYGLSHNNRYSHNRKYLNELPSHRSIPDRRTIDPFGVFATTDTIAAGAYVDIPVSDWSPKETRSFLKQQRKAGKDRELRARHFESLEGGARALKIALENGRDNQGELRLYRLELMAKKRHPDTRGEQVLFTNLYGAFSDFGFSVFKPIGCAFVALIAFGIFYGWWAIWAASASPSLDTFVEGLNFSGQSVLKPFSYWGYEEFQGKAAGDHPILGNAGNRSVFGIFEVPASAGSLLIRLVASVQSLFSIVMLFLSGLAARRYFQMR